MCLVLVFLLLALHCCSKLLLDMPMGTLRVWYIQHGCQCVVAWDFHFIHHILYRSSSTVHMVVLSFSSFFTFCFYHFCCLFVVVAVMIYAHEPRSHCCRHKHIFHSKWNGLFISSSWFYSAMKQIMSFLPYTVVEYTLDRAVEATIYLYDLS